MSNPFDIDDLKNDWQNQAIKSVSSEKINEFTHKKTDNNVKYILIISIIEFIIGILIFALLFFGDQSTNNDLPIRTQKDLEVFIRYLHISFLIYPIVFAWFIYQFFKYYRELKIESSIKNYISKIISFRKVANYFVIFNILIFSIIFISCFVFALYEVVYIYQQKFSKSIETGQLASVIVVVLFICCIAIGLVWLYYRIVYGTFLRRLKQNLKELNTTEN